MKNKRIWHLICAKWIGWSIHGATVCKARPEGGKYIDAKDLPEHVRTGFDISEDGRFVQSFTSEKAIEMYKENGASVKPFNLIFYRITFEVTDCRKRTNLKAKERAKYAKRDRLGRFEPNSRLESDDELGRLYYAGVLDSYGKRTS